jgi:excisionase family DNA binding protein
MTKKTLGVRQTANRLGCTMKYVYDLLYGGRLPGRKQHGKWRIPLRAVEMRLRAREAADGTTRR